MENKEDGRVVTFRDLWNLLIRHILVVGLVAVLGTALFYAGIRMGSKPQYQSTITMYIQRESNSSSVGDASSEFSLALKLVKDCTYFIRSHTVLDQVIEELDLDMSYKQLYSSISAHNPENTRILEITVRAGTPELAKKIADRIGQIAPQVIEQTMGHKQIALFEAGTLNRTPCNQTGVLVYGLVFVLFAAVTYAVYLVLYLLDDRIRTDEDVERVLGLTVLGSIPDASAISRGEDAYYGYRIKPEKGRKKQKRGSK